MLFFLIVAFRKNGTIQRHLYEKQKSNNCQDFKWIRKNTMLYLILNIAFSTVANVTFDTLGNLFFITSLCLNWKKRRYSENVYTLKNQRN